MKVMRERLKEIRKIEEKERKKAIRDAKIKGEERVRTYDFPRGVVTDHRSKKTASIKDILFKGLLDKLKNRKHN